MEIVKLKELANHELPFFRYIAEDKSKYKTATQAGYIDRDNDFLIGDSDGFLLNIDFVFINTEVFTEVGRHFDRTGEYFSYTELDSYHKGMPVSVEFTRFWTREANRRRNGMTANCKLYFKDMEEYFDPNTSNKRKEQLLKPLRITGDHYNFLNYGRIYRSLTKEERSKYPKNAKIPKKRYGFPGFIDGQYWNFKIDEFIANNEYHLCKSKARRKGYSYMRGSQGASTVNSNKNVTIVLAAYDLSYLTDPGATTDMVKTNLDWYETNTVWKRLYLSENLRAIELGYKKSKEGNIKYGYRSKVLSEACAKNESAVVGKDAFEIDFEESGKFPNLSEVMDVTTSTTEDGAQRTGTIRIYGTGGTKDANWEAFSKYFYNPVQNEMMPFENVFDDNSRHLTCGFFHGQYWGYFPYVDEHGNSLLIEAYNHDYARKEEAKRTKKVSDAIIFIAQRANKPSEAFLNTRDNLFASSALNDWIIRLEHDTDVQFYKDGIVQEDKDSGKISFVTNETLRSRNEEYHDYIEDFPLKRDTDIRGCIRQLYPPYYIDGHVPEGTYFITYDPVGLDIDKKNLTIRHSLNSIKVWMYPFNPTPFGGKRIVASYAGRFDTLTETDAMILRLAKYYNAKILPETDRGEIVKNFKSWGELPRLLKDPTSIISKGRYAPNASYGMKIGDLTTKLEALRQLKELLYTNMGTDENDKPIYFLHYIYDITFLKELQKFTVGGNFDRISDAVLATYEYNRAYIEEDNNKYNKTTTRNNRLFNRLING